MRLVPNSWGSPVREYNPCHKPGGSPGGGQFATKGTGQCEGGVQTASDRAEFQRLKGQWARVNNDLLEHIEHPDSPEARAKMLELKTIVKQMYRLNADPGGLEGVGLPGGPRDIAIVGAGPGGLAAAVMGGTDGLDTLFIEADEKVGGQAKFSSRIENYPGFPIGASGKRLAETLHEQAMRVGAEGKLGVRVTGLAYDEATGLKTLTLSNGETVTARSVIIAGGVQFRRMDFPGSDSKSVVYGNAEDLAEIAKGRTAVVVGGSNGAAQAALGVARSAREVYVVSRSPLEKGMSDYQVSALANHPKIKVLVGEEIAALESGGSLRLKSGKSIKADGVGLFIGSAPKTDWLPNGIARNARGQIRVNDDLETGIRGVFAVGDIREGGIGRIGAAVGDGQYAQRNVFQYFKRLADQRKARGT